MVLDKEFSRRQVLRIGAGGAVAVGLAPLGPSLRPCGSARGPRRPRSSRPPRWARSRSPSVTCRAAIGIAASAERAWRLNGLTSAVPTSPKTPRISVRWCRCRVAGRSSSSTSPCRLQQIEFAGYNQNAANPGGAPQPAPAGRPTSAGAYLAYGIARCGVSSTSSVSRPSATTALSRTPGQVRPARAAECRRTTTTGSRPSSSLPRSSACRSWAPATTRTGSAHNRNIEAWTLAGEKWEALNVLSLQWGIHLYPHNHAEAYHFLQDGPTVTVTRIE